MYEHEDEHEHSLGNEEDSEASNYDRGNREGGLRLELRKTRDSGDPLECPLRDWELERGKYIKCGYSTGDHMNWKARKRRTSN